MLMEAASRFELEIEVLQTSALATWLCRHMFTTMYCQYRGSTQALSRVGKAYAKAPQNRRAIAWCQGPESNWRHRDFQSRALPTELPWQAMWDLFCGGPTLAEPTGLEPAISALTGLRVKPATPRLHLQEVCYHAL